MSQLQPRKRVTLENWLQDASEAAEELRAALVRETWEDIPQEESYDLMAACEELLGFISAFKNEAAERALQEGLERNEAEKDEHRLTLRQVL